MPLPGDTSTPVQLLVIVFFVTPFATTVTLASRPGFMLSVWYDQVVVVCAYVPDAGSRPTTVPYPRTSPAGETANAPYEYVVETSPVRPSLIVRAETA